MGVLWKYRHVTKSGRWGKEFGEGVQTWSKYAFYVHVHLLK